MAAKNDITGDSIQTRGVSDAYRDGWDRMFGKKPKKVIVDEIEVSENGNTSTEENQGKE